MQITFFTNKKGLIRGDDPKRIVCGLSGVLKIGHTEITLRSDTEEIMPMLFHGCSGDYPASFVSDGGEEYDLGKAEVRGGWIRPPDPVWAELAELRVRADEAEKQIERLSRLFDTDALNFLTG